MLVLQETQTPFNTSFFSTVFEYFFPWNLTSKNCNSACQQHGGADHWYFFSTVFEYFFPWNLTSKNCNSACQQHGGADHWYLGSIAKVTFTTVDFTFRDFYWGVGRFANLQELAASWWSGASFFKDFNRLAWDLRLYFSFATTILAVLTVCLPCRIVAFIPALIRETLVASQGITWKT